MTAQRTAARPVESHRRTFTVVRLASKPLRWRHVMVFLYITLLEAIALAAIATAVHSPRVASTAIVIAFLAALGILVDRVEW
jgi:hypothetical protein